MRLTPDQSRRLNALLLAPENFQEMINACGLDRQKDFRNGDWRGVDFGEDDLSGIDFSGSDLTGANFSKARGLENAAFKNCVGTPTAMWRPHEEPAPSLSELISDFNEPLFAGDRNACSRLRMFLVWPVMSTGSADDIIKYADEALLAVPEHWRKELPWFKFNKLFRHHISESLHATRMTLESALLAILARREFALNELPNTGIRWRDFNIIPCLYGIEGFRDTINLKFGYDNTIEDNFDIEYKSSFTDLKNTVPVSIRNVTGVINHLRKIAPEWDYNYNVTLNKNTFSWRSLLNNMDTK